MSAVRSTNLSSSPRRISGSFISSIRCLKWLGQGNSSVSLAPTSTALTKITVQAEAFARHHGPSKTRAARKGVRLSSGTATSGSTARNSTFAIINLIRLFVLVTNNKLSIHLQRQCSASRLRTDRNQRSNSRCHNGILPGAAHPGQPGCWSPAVIMTMPKPDCSRRHRLTISR